MNADVVIVGGGAGGSMAAYKLATKGLNVLVLEAGPEIDRGQAVDRFRRSPTKGVNSPYKSEPYAPFITDEGGFYTDVGPMKFEGAYLRILGGTTWHWTGFADRLRPADFLMKDTYGVGVNWPIPYKEMLPYWTEAEKEWGVAGFDNHVWGAPRCGEPFPLPGIPNSYLDQVVTAACKRLGLTVAPFTHARNSVYYDHRPPCCGNNSCVPICPVHAKYDATVHVVKARNKGARFITRAVASRIRINAKGLVESIQYKRPDGSQREARGKVYILACHAIETPKLMLISRGEYSPAGVANSSGLVGKNLISQININTRGLAPIPLFTYRGPQQTSGITELRDGAFRAHHAAIGTSFMNDGWKPGFGPIDQAKTLIENGLRGKALRDAVADRSAREIRLNSSCEVLANPTNWVKPDFERTDALGIPFPKVRFAADSYTLDAVQIAVKRDRSILEALGATEIDTDSAGSTSSAIIAGTTMMGSDPRHSVVGPDLKSWDHDNLYIVGPSTHPTAPINAPTLTVAACAIRVAQEIEKRLSLG